MTITDSRPSEEQSDLKWLPAFPCCHVLKTFAQPFHIIGIHCSDLLICMVAALLPAQGQEIGPQ